MSTLKHLISFVIVYVVILTNTTAYACYVCFSQAADDPHNIALSKSIMFLLGVILCIFLLLGKFFLSVRHREKMMIENDEGVL